MKKGRIAILLSLVVAASAFAVGCGQKQQPAPEEKTQTEEKQEQKEEAKEEAKPEAKEAITAGMVTDVGGINDQSFNQTSWAGLQRAEKELGADVTYVESKQESDYSANLETLLDQNRDIIWGIGFMMGDAVKEEAENNPDQLYGCIDAFYAEAPENLIGITFREQEPSYLVGYIAGKMTKTNKVGFIGGMKGDVISRFHYGYKAGVKAANPDCEILEQYAESFGDTAKGKAIATQMYQKGADIVFHAAGYTGTGVIEAAKENNKYAIGVDVDQSYLAPDNVITSAVKRVDVAMFDKVKQLKEGTFEGGKQFVYGLAENGVDIAATSDKHVPKEILDEVNGLKQQIIDGKIKIPVNEEEYKAMFEK